MADTRGYIPMHPIRVIMPVFCDAGIVSTDSEQEKRGGLGRGRRLDIQALGSTS